MDAHLEQERRARARERQRRYRAARPRIDYFPDPHAVVTIDSLRTRYAGGDASSIINRIVREWSGSRSRIGHRGNRVSGDGIPRRRTDEEDGKYDARAARPEKLLRRSC
jgi:hypothetical protein